MGDRVLLVFAAGLLVIGGVMLFLEPDPVVPKGGLILEKPIEWGEWGEGGETFEAIDWDMKPATKVAKVSFHNEDREIIVIDLETGNVTLAEGLEMDEASREFWKILRLHLVPCPSLEKEEQP